MSKVDCPWRCVVSADIVDTSEFPCLVPCQLWHSGRNFASWRIFPQCGLVWHFCRTKFAWKIFPSCGNSHEECSKFFPEMFEPLFCGSEKSRKFPPNFPQNCPPKILKNHRRASAGAQVTSEQFGLVLCYISVWFWQSQQETKEYLKQRGT